MKKILTSIILLTAVVSGVVMKVRMNARRRRAARNMKMIHGLLRHSYDKARLALKISGKAIKELPVLGRLTLKAATGR